MLKESKIRSSEGINNSQFFLLHHHRITSPSCVVHWPRWSELTLSLVESNLVAVLLPRLPVMTLKFFRIYCLPHSDQRLDSTKTMMIFELSENSLARLNRNYSQEHDVLTTTTNGEDAAERDGREKMVSTARQLMFHDISLAFSLGVKKRASLCCRSVSCTCIDVFRHAQL